MPKHWAPALALLLLFLGPCGMHGACTLLPSFHDTFLFLDTTIWTLGEGLSHCTVADSCTYDSMQNAQFNAVLDPLQQQQQQVAPAPAAHRMLAARDAEGDSMQGHPPAAAATALGVHVRPRLIGHELAPTASMGARLLRAIGRTQLQRASSGQGVSAASSGQGVSAASGSIRGSSSGDSSSGSDGGGSSGSGGGRDSTGSSTRRSMTEATEQFEEQPWMFPFSVPAASAVADASVQSVEAAVDPPTATDASNPAPLPPAMPASYPATYPSSPPSPAYSPATYPPTSALPSMPLPPLVPPATPPPAPSPPAGPPAAPPRGLHLTLSQTPCQQNRTACCAPPGTTVKGLRCARWSGAHMQTASCLHYGSLEVVMAVRMPPGTYSVLYLGLYSGPGPNNVNPWQEVDLGWTGFNVVTPSSGSSNSSIVFNGTLITDTYMNGLLTLGPKVNLGLWSDLLQFRRYRLDWSNASLSWSVDGAVVYSLSGANLVPDLPQSLRLILRTANGPGNGPDTEVWIQEVTYNSASP